MPSCVRRLFCTCRKFDRGVERSDSKLGFFNLTKMVMYCKSKALMEKDKMAFASSIFLILMIPGFALAGVPDQDDDPHLGLIQRPWLERAGKNLKENGEVVSAGGSVQRAPSGMNALVVKFSKYDVLFWDVIDNAARGGTDGYQFKYKFFF
jgi:hypothetical protein